MTTTAELRKSFISYFESKGHTPVPSSSLVPVGDPTLLFTNAGMVQFKDTFLGAETRPYTRAATSQKCLRISGKHNDLENVGRTARHHTFFEMLGNFSFGDYFKTDAIKFGWEYLTETLQLDKQRLWVTVFEDDDEAKELWKKHTDVIPERILKCGEKDNFWAMGDVGPCGPCSEIHYFLGEDVKNQSEADFRKDDGSYLEIWNLVFMQFNRDASGNLTPLPSPSVDTGMGLERIAAVKQGVKANYDIDSFQRIISEIEKLCGKKYYGKDYTPVDTDQYRQDVAFRVIADHLRASSFLIADGIRPTSDGRGYVVRRLIRRACKHSKDLGFNEPFLCKLAAVVVKEYGEFYPELVEAQDKIKTLLESEESRFLQTLDSGLSVLEGFVSELAGKKLGGEQAFQLYDTYGFPLDLTQSILEDRGLEVDTEGYQKAMQEQRERSRGSRSSDFELKLKASVSDIKSEFVGYDYTTYETELSAIFNEEGTASEAAEGERVGLVLGATPFYSESGGQVGDSGMITTGNAVVEILDTQKSASGIPVHFGRVVDGSVSVGDSVRADIDEVRRRDIAVHHSATHLLHQALREVLGEHVEQAGSRVDQNTLRFDFSHSSAVSAEQLQEIQLRVSELICENNLVETKELPIEEAKETGARALFGEKYGDVVRVVYIGPGSIEFCGGTHVSRSGDLGAFGICSESSVSAGVRRIEAVSGKGAIKRQLASSSRMAAICSSLSASEEEVVDRIRQLGKRVSELETQLKTVKKQSLKGEGSNLLEEAVEIPGGKLVAKILNECSADELRALSDDLRQKLGSGVVALASKDSNKTMLLLAVTDDLAKKYNAVDTIRRITKETGGGGGGKPTLAQAGVKDYDKLVCAIKDIRSYL